MGVVGSRARRRQRSNALYIVLGLLVGSAVVAGLVYQKQTEDKALNPDTLCPMTGPMGHTVLLVDKSDPLNFTQRRDFEVLLEEIVKRRVPKGHLLSVYALGDDIQQTAKPIVELCNPGDGSDQNEWTGAPEKAKTFFNSNFANPVLSKSKDLMVEKPGKASPILEMVQLVGITGFRAHAVHGDKRLIVVSDMIQNTPQLNMYKGIPEYSDFATTPYGVKSAADLPAVSVELQVFLHTPQVQKPELLQFWQQHISRAKGKLDIYNPIKG